MRWCASGFVRNAINSEGMTLLMLLPGQLCFPRSQACQGALVPEAVRALISGSDVFFAD